MKLLIITQKVDRNDPVLGFFHRWIEEFAKHFEKISVICLEKGEFNLPANVKVYSLGKEEGKSRIKYVLRFYKYIWNLRKDYDAVFVHMNQEYILLGWKFWKLWRKKIFLWRNHAKGNWLTRIAVFVSNKVFATSRESYTARFKKTVIMPAGIDTDFFKPDASIQKKPNSILFLGRIAPVKRVLEFVDWLNILKVQGKEFSATIAGVVLPKDSDYDNLVREKISGYGLGDRVEIIGAVTQAEALKLYQSHETYVNLTQAGSMDKAILEAAACEMVIKVENTDLKILEGKEGKELRNFVVVNHSLKVLMDKLMKEL